MREKEKRVIALDKLSARETLLVFTASDTNALMGIETGKVSALRRWLCRFQWTFDHNAILV